MFPGQIDGADVLLYTEKGDYGCLCHDSGEIADHICYFCIARYPDDDIYYLFECNAEYSTVSDSDCDSMENCKRLAANLSAGRLGACPVWHDAIE